MTCVECRSASSAAVDKSDSAAGDYDTLDLETRGQQPHYDVMPRDLHQRDTAADDYVTLDADSQAQQHPYDVVRPTI